MRRSRRHNTGFTFMELLVTLLIIGVCFWPITRMFSAIVQEAAYLGDLITSLGLARQEMEKIKNLALTEKQIIEKGDIIYPKVEMNNVYWIIERDIEEDSDPLKVVVRVSLENELEKPMAELVTLVEDWKD